MRKIVLDIGFSPGDIVVFTRALRDLCEQYPELDVTIRTCCPAIFEANPFVNKKQIAEELYMVPEANNLVELGYSLYEVVKNPDLLFKEMATKNKMNAVFKDDKWNYIDKESKKEVFYCKQKEQPRIEEETYNVQYEDIHNSGWSGRHVSNAFVIELEEKLGVKIKQSSLLPDLHLSEEEKKWVNQVEQEFNYRGKFWLINSGHKKDYPLKQWGFGRWQKLVYLLKDRIQFVQIGELGDNHIHQELDGTFNLLGKTDLRQLIRLSYHAQGGVSHVSLLHHLMAAWQKPCVTIAGGREPRRWESYPHIRYMDTNGLLPCCAYDGCWQTGRMEGDCCTLLPENKTCKNMVGCEPKCFAMIEPEQVARELMNYFYGGVLQF